MDFAQGFTLWRELGKTPDGEFLPFAALTAIHYTHRNFGGLVVLAFIGLIWKAWRAHPSLHPLAGGLACVLLMQVVSGLATIFFSLPLFFAVLHNAGAALLVLLLCMLHYRVAIQPVVIMNLSNKNLKP
jgi:cytochrome c oxidase assembly protein subunit 15